MNIINSILIVVLLFSCSNNKINKTEDVPDEFKQEEKTETKILNKKGSTIEERFNPPVGFKREESDDKSFTYYLRNLPLKPHGSKVKYYDGKTKNRTSVYDAVVDMPIGQKDLHQCADAVMRLRADYLYKNKEEDKIKFNFTSGFPAEYKKWKEGYRFKVSGNNVSWYKSSGPDNSYKSFNKYLEWIYMYAGSLSLSKELKNINYEEMKTGDVLIQGGSPGHAVIIVDMAVNPETKEKVYLLAQSYMPAQEIQLLANLQEEKISPWYRLNKSKTKIYTPEWTFNTTDLKRFQN